MSYFDEHLKDRDNPYEIDLELIIRKMFENKTDYTFEFTKNDDKYGYDITVFKYYISGGDYKKIPIAYIEIEVSENWKSEYPSYWKDYSFLMRKVYEYDYENNIFLDTLKENVNKTIYIIFNKTLSDYICKDMIYIAGLTKKKRKVVGDNRHDWVLTTNKYDSGIIRGVPQCLNFSYKFIKDKSKEQ